MFTREENIERLYRVFMRRNRNIFEEDIVRFEAVTTDDVIVEFKDGKKILYKCSDGYRRNILYENEYVLSDRQIMSEFIIRFEKLLEDKNMTKTILAVSTGIDRRNLSSYCAHKIIPKITTLAIIAKKLNCRVQDFFYTEKPYRLDGIPDLIDETGIRFYFARKLGDCVESSRLDKRKCVIDLADYIGVTDRTVYRYLDALTVPNIIVLKRIADFFDKDIEYFFMTKEREY